ncbi:Rha family transcriptional regulator [Aeromonas sp. AE23HZ002T15]
MNTITSFTPTDLITLYHGQPMTTSLKVAEVFGKLHKNVLRKIESLDCSPEFNELNFEPVEYLDEKGETRKAWNMTKDGFIFLVMGFTGKLAARFKETYIRAFNWMAEQLSQQVPQSIRIPAPSGSDGTYCGRLLVSVEFDRITGCRPLPDDAFIATPATLSGHLHENWAITNEQLRSVAETCLYRLTKRAVQSSIPLTR